VGREMRGGEGSWGTSRFGGVRRVVVGGGCREVVGETLLNTDIFVHSLI